MTFSLDVDLSELFELGLDTRLQETEIEVLRSAEGVYHSVNGCGTGVQLKIVYSSVPDASRCMRCFGQVVTETPSLSRAHLVGCYIRAVLDMEPEETDDFKLAHLKRSHRFHLDFLENLPADSGEPWVELRARSIKVLKEALMRLEIRQQSREHRDTLQHWAAQQAGALGGSFYGVVTQLALTEDTLPIFDVFSVAAHDSFHLLKGPGEVLIAAGVNPDELVQAKESWSQSDLSGALVLLSDGGMYNSLQEALRVSAAL